MESNVEKQLAQKAYSEILNASNKAEVESIYRKYILYVLDNYLNEKLFKGFLKQLLSMQRESQSAAQTNYNTMVAMELLKDGN
ncbi:MAG: hypothetical protein SPI86_09705 [Treponemataceae bacterium]|nr:hypothetical protein [Treponemataceae bacterium]